MFTIKQALFCYTLRNLRLSLRSSLKCIQLVAVTKSDHISKYGIDVILEPHMNSIKMLEQVNYTTYVRYINIFY
jgi:hypothetical protein